MVCFRLFATSFAELLSVVRDDPLCFQHKYYTVSIHFEESLHICQIFTALS